MSNLFINFDQNGQPDNPAILKQILDWWQAKSSQVPDEAIVEGTLTDIHTTREAFKAPITDIQVI
jgi:hypothetical protein